MITEQVRSPISAEAPGGRDVRYDDEFDALKNEVGKQSAVASRTDFDRLVQRGSQLVGGKAGGDGVGTLTEAAGGPDYSRIVDLATNILSSKSKDLQVAGFLCMGLYRSQRYTGLAEGLEIYKALIEGFWDTLYPELRRLEGRRNAVQWVAENISNLVPVLPPEPGEREDVERAIATGKAIDALLRERVADMPPSLSALTRALNEALEGLPAPRATASEAPAGTPAAAIPVTLVAPAMAEVKSEDDADLAVARAADFLRGAQPKWPVGYRLMRSLRWDAIETLPPSEGGRTPLGAPPDDYRTRLQMAQSGGSPADALGACEEIFYEAPNHFWLDLQRVADQSLGAMGPDYTGLRRLLRHEVARLIERLPGIENLSFSDGTPFADGATREWIDREVRPLSSAAPATAAAAGPGDEALTAQLAEARTLADGGDLAGALDMLQSAQGSDARRRPRFLRQLAMARLCIAHGKPAAARPLLEGLDQLCDRYGLQGWEPELCIQVWTLLRRCYESLLPDALPQAKEDYEKRMHRCFDKLCRIDVRLAVSEGGGA